MLIDGLAHVSEFRVRVVCPGGAEVFADEIEDAFLGCGVGTVVCRSE